MPQCDTTIATPTKEFTLSKSLTGDDSFKNFCFDPQNDVKNSVVSSSCWRGILTMSNVACQMMVPSFFAALVWCIVVLSQNENSSLIMGLYSSLYLLPYIQLIFSLRYLAYKNLFTNQLSPITILISFVAADVVLVIFMPGNGGSPGDWIALAVLTSMAVSGIIYTIAVTLCKIRQGQQTVSELEDDNGFNEDYYLV
jgi:hypothetical protein